jgi:hypothetical protein
MDSQLSGAADAMKSVARLNAKSEVELGAHAARVRFSEVKHENNEIESASNSSRGFKARAQRGFKTCNGARRLRRFDARSNRDAEAA